MNPASYPTAPAIAPNWSYPPRDSSPPIGASQCYDEIKAFIGRLSYESFQGRRVGQLEFDTLAALANDLRIAAKKEIEQKDQLIASQARLIGILKDEMDAANEIPACECAGLKGTVARMKTEIDEKDARLAAQASTIGKLLDANDRAKLCAERQDAYMHRLFDERERANKREAAATYRCEMYQTANLRAGKTISHLLGRLEDAREAADAAEERMAYLEDVIAGMNRWGPALDEARKLAAKLCELGKGEHTIQVLIK